MTGELLLIGAGLVLVYGFLAGRQGSGVELFSVPEFNNLTGEDLPIFSAVTDAEVSGADLPRGIRNHNPGNIEWSAANDWRGQVGHDGRYIIFETPHFGIRALAKLLLNYNKLYGLETVYSIISRWAPNTENNTSSYIRAVSDALGVDPLQVVDVKAYLPELVRAVIHHENGMQPYNALQITAAIEAI